MGGWWASRRTSTGRVLGLAGTLRRKALVAWVGWLHRRAKDTHARRNKVVSAAAAQGATVEDLRRATGLTPHRITRILRDQDAAVGRERGRRRRPGPAEVSRVRGRKAGRSPGTSS